MLIFDAHLDLSMNALEWNRDLTRPIDEIRQREAGLSDKKDRARGTVCLPAMRRGRVGLCVATQIARYVRPANPLPGWHSPEQAWAQTQGQLAWYQAMEARGEMVQIKDADALEKSVQLWQSETVHEDASSQHDPNEANPRQAGAHRSPAQEENAGEAKLPIGYILSLEGADSILSLAHLQRSYEEGLRAVGPAHYGPGTYAQGTDASGGLGPRGRELLAEMERLGIILDATHLCDESFWEAVDCFHGSIWASHSNCRSLVPHNRQFSDEQIRLLIERGAVIGAVLDAWMMVPGWIRQKTLPETVGLKMERLVDHIDYVCQIAGNARHCGVGSDLDGGFGREQTPADLDTIADLARLPQMLRDRGYKFEDVRQIMHGNFIRFLKTTWAA